MTNLKPSTSQALTKAEKLLATVETEKTADVWAGLKLVRRELLEALEDEGDDSEKRAELQQVGTVLEQVKNAILEVNAVLSGKMPKPAAPEQREHVYYKRKPVHFADQTSYRAAERKAWNAASSSFKEASVAQKKNLAAHLLEIFAAGYPGMTDEKELALQAQATELLDNPSADAWNDFMYNLFYSYVHVTKRT